MNSIASIVARAVHHLVVVIVIALPTLAPAQTVQEHVHGHGHEVMPFDLAKTVHTFRMTEEGGVQSVMLRGDAADPEQVRMIQQHLSMEAAEFQKGNFAAPGRLHGSAMPGLRELQAGARDINITYRPLPRGTEIAFRASDIKLVTAIHRWFGAQLSERGPDARAD
jgi:hypothetical protein